MKSKQLVLFLFVFFSFTCFLLVKWSVYTCAQLVTMSMIGLLTEPLEIPAELQVLRPEGIQRRWELEWKMMKAFGGET